MVKINPADGAGNMLLIEHIPDMALMEPNKARDQAIEKENYAAVSKAAQNTMRTGRSSYRSFVGDDYWSELTFPK